MVWFDGEQPTSGVKWGWPVCGPKNRAAEGEKLTRCNGAAVACLAFPKPLVRRCCGEGGEGEAEFMPVAAVHPPSPTPRSYLVELSRSAIPPNHHREYRHETEPRTRTHTPIHARSFCAKLPLWSLQFSPFVSFLSFKDLITLQFLSLAPPHFSPVAGGRCFEGFTINLSNEIQDRDHKR